MSRVKSAIVIRLSFPILVFPRSISLVGGAVESFCCAIRRGDVSVVNTGLRRGLIADVLSTQRDCEVGVNVGLCFVRVDPSRLLLRFRKCEIDGACASVGKGQCCKSNLWLIVDDREDLALLSCVNGKKIK